MLGINALKTGDDYNASTFQFLRNLLRINAQNACSSEITVSNNSVYVDGKLVQKELSGVVKIEFEGDLASLTSEGSVSVNGNVKGDVDAGGSVACGNVEGDVDAGGSVNCGNVEGDVDAGGSISMRR